MEQQQIIRLDEYKNEIQKSSDHFRDIWLSKEVKHYIFNYMSSYSAKIICIILSIELEQLKTWNLEKELTEIADFMNNLELIHKKVNDNDFLHELEKKYKKWLIDSKEMLSLLLIDNEDKIEIIPRNNIDKPASYSDVG